MKWFSHRSTSIHGLAALLLLMSGCSTAPPVPKLHKMITEGDIDGARKLIERRVDINLLSEEGFTPLHLATSRGYRGLVESLVAAGADLNLRSNRGETALVIASRRPTSELAKFLAERGARVDPAYKGTNAFSEAVRRGHLDLVGLFISRGANIEVRNHFGETPLFYAVYFGNEATIRLLVKNGASINATADDGRTVLHVAALKQDWVVIDLLMRLGAEVRDADASEVALYSTARLYEYLGDTALGRNDSPRGISHLRRAASYYSKAARKFEQVASNHAAAAERVLEGNRLSVAFAALAAFGQAHSQASTMAQVTPRGQTASGFGVSTYTVQSTQHLQSLVARYRALALMSKDAGARLLSLVSCIEARSDAIQTCRRRSP